MTESAEQILQWPEAAVYVALILACAWVVGKMFE
jgi:hypothetical protein